MISEGKVLAIIPARAGSKGLPRKNVMILGGKCLFQWPLDAALDVGGIDLVIVTSDDAEIEDIVVDNYSNKGVVFDRRPKSLAGDKVPSSDVVMHVLSRYATSEFSHFVLLEPTSPLTTATDIQQSLDILRSAANKAEALVGVGRLESAHPAFVYSRDSRHFLSPFAGVTAGHSQRVLRRQDLSDLFYLDGSIYISEIKSYYDKRSFMTSRTIGKVFNKHKNIEIDDLLDYYLISALVTCYLVDGEFATNSIDEGINE